MASLAVGISWELIDGIPSPAVRPAPERPRGRVAPRLDQEEEPATVLVYGKLPRLLERALKNRGATLVKVSTMSGALRALAGGRFRSVAVNPRARFGIELIKLVKGGSLQKQAVSETLWQAASRHQETPFVVLPLPGDDEYAVIIEPPLGSFLERSLPIVRALLDLDPHAALMALERGIRPHVPRWGGRN